MEIVARLYIRDACNKVVINGNCCPVIYKKWGIQTEISGFTRGYNNAQRGIKVIFFTKREKKTFSALGIW